MIGLITKGKFSGCCRVIEKIVEVPGGPGGGYPAYMPSFSFRLDSITGKRKDLQVKVKRMEEESVEKIVDVEETEIK